MQYIDNKPPLFITLKGEPVGRAEGLDAHGTLLDERAAALGMDPDEYFDQSDLIYVDSGSDLLLFDARPELGEGKVREAIEEYLMTTDISHAEMSFYGTNEREIVENPGNIDYVFNLQ